MVYHIIIMEKQGDFQGDYFQEIRQQSSTAEKNDEQKRRRLHYLESPDEPPVTVGRVNGIHLKPWNGKVEEHYNHLCIYMYDYTRFFLNTNRDQILLMTPEPAIHTMIPLPQRTVNVNHEIKR